MITEILLFITILMLIIIKGSQKPKGLPPGDWGLPLVGLLPQGRKAFDKMIQSHLKRFGYGVYCMKVGTRTAVFISDYHLLKKALLKPELSARPNVFSMNTLGEKLGMTMASGRVWEANRRFSVKTLKDFGMGKRSMEPIIETEVELLVDYYKQRVGKPIYLTNVINVAIVNGLWTLISGRRYELDDPHLSKLSDKNRDNFESIMNAVQFLDIFPKALEFLPHIVQNALFRAGDLRDNRESFKAFVKQIIKEHKENLDESVVETFIDSYLLDIKNNKNPELSFRDDENNLVHILFNFFIGGSFSTAANIRWFINFMAMYPEIQEKIQQELDTHVPRDRYPVFDDKENLPYFEACINESLRNASFFLMTIPHSAASETELDGYIILKDSIVMGCLEECNKNPNHWKHPREFYPEHFLDQDGKFTAKKEGFIPFSAGKRSCPGESYARMDMFLICSAILQQFKITPAPGVKITHDAAQIGHLFNFPQQYELIFENRS